MSSIIFRTLRKKKYRALCYSELIKIGYNHLVLYFEKLINTYDSYWGSDDKRIEVQYNPDTGEFWANEFEQIKLT